MTSTRRPGTPSAGRPPRSPLTYLYCLVRARRRPSLAGVPRGLPRTGRVRLLDAGRGLYLVAADAPASRFGEAAVEAGLRDVRWVSRCALAHEAVVEAFAGAEALVPMKLLTLFSSDERALAHVARERERLQRVTRRVAGCSEWGVRVVLDEAAALAAAAEEVEVQGDGGRAFLARKKAVRDARRRVGAEAVARAEALFAAIARRAADATRREAASRDPAPAGRVMLEAAFLVRRTAVASFRTTVRRHAAELAGGGYSVTLTGPWPPYSFVVEVA